MTAPTRPDIVWLIDQFARAVYQTEGTERAKKTFAYEELLKAYDALQLDKSRMDWLDTHDPTMVDWSGTSVGAAIDAAMAAERETDATRPRVEP